MSLALQNGQTLVCIGDSITDANRREDAGPLGRGYVKLFADLVMIRHPDRQVKIFNRGINGDRVNSGLPHIPNSGLTNRWDRDVLQLRPDWLSIMIGINDVTSNITPGVTPVTPDIYEATYDRLLTDTRRALPACRILLLEPFYLHHGTLADPVQQRVATLVADYIAAVQRLSRKHATRLVRTHHIFQNLIARFGTATFGPENVHPNPTGHLVIAEALYQTFCGESTA